MTTRAYLALAPFAVTFATIVALAVLAGADAVLAGGLITIGALAYVAANADR